MERRRWIAVLSGLLMLLLNRPGVADDTVDGRIRSPRRLFTDQPLFPEPVFEFPTAPAVPAAPEADQSDDPVPAPSDEPDFPPPPELPPVAPPSAPPRSGVRPEPKIIVDNESSWLNRVVDEHLLIWRELPGSFEFIPGGGGGFGVTTLGFESPIIFEDSPRAWFVPKFGWHFLSGPRSPDLPAQLYTLALEFNLALDLGESTRLHFQIAPTWATDFNAGGSESFRMIAGGLVAHDLSREWMLALGGVYLDRPDLPALPLGGLRWRPADNLELDFMFPQPRAAWRISTDDSGDTRWFYMGGGLGGHSWAFDQVTGPTNRVGYLDLRLLMGVELRETDGGRHIFEAGYVFDRRLDFDRGPGDQHLPGTAVIRLGAIY